MATENADAAVIGKVNVGDNMELAVKYGISGVPTILIFKGGEIVERTAGYQEKESLQKLLDSHA